VHRGGRRSWATIGNARRLSGNISLWQPDDVALRTALGKALFRAPDRLRKALPRVVRDGVRRRVGPFAPWEAGFAPRGARAPARRGDGTARLRRHRGAEGGDHVVVRIARRPSRRRAPRRHPQGTPLLRSLCNAPLRHRTGAGVPPVVPPPRRQEDGGVDTGLPVPAVGRAHCSNRPHPRRVFS